MAELLPYGVSSSSMKEMGQTTKAWMQVLDVEKSVPVYKVRASMEDSACVTEVNGVHYGLAREENGELLPVIVDREVLFQEDTSLRYPHGFVQNTTEKLLEAKQCTCNDAACCFFLAKRTLQPGEEMILEELYGMAESKEILEQLIKRTQEPKWFDKKRQIAARLTRQLTDRIATRTGNQVFDAYCRQTYLDNLLRGGYPVQIGNKVVYLYSRKHGDMERDYNYFSMLPEYYSQGNGNFRDVNQNRRCEPQFAPFVGDRNIRLFYNALQIDGYNPLKIEKVSYILDKKEFTPGELYQSLEQKNGPKQKEETDREFAQLLSKSEEKETTSFGEGYWCDHWIYNLDLVESYLGVFPEKKEALLFEDNSYTYRQSEAHILPRAKRYAKTPDGIRQYHFLEMPEEPVASGNFCLKDEKGNTVTSTLFEKMFSLAVVKMAALDPYGMGIEMEGGKPGWYDALNGLPGLLGSSMAETCELERLVEYLLQALTEIPEKQNKTITILTEIEELAQKILESGRNYMEEKQDPLEAVGFWNQINLAKEAFREKTAQNVKGTVCVKSAAQLGEILLVYKEVLEKGIRKSRRLEDDVPATYYYYEVTEYQEVEEGILPTAFAVHKTPDFLEGTVHSLKLSMEKENKKKLYDLVRNSRLFDRKLGMYKVNASLSEASFELGRACAFTPGWLENESVWLHMEYKYLLELLKTGLYEEFEQDFHRCAIPFLDETMYGRSILENSSFLASSVNPNEKIHGKGFVARLSGSTAEFLQMWQIMMFGKNLFTVENGELTLKFAPTIPEYLIGEEKKIEASFLGSTPVEYHLADAHSFYPGNYQVGAIEIHWKSGDVNVTDRMGGAFASKIRAGEADRILVQLKR